MKSALLALSLVALAGCGFGFERAHRPLAIGSAAPDFALPGVDGAIHKLDDYAKSPVLVLVATCNHCPEAQLYENRIKKLHEDYREKGVTVILMLLLDPDRKSTRLNSSHLVISYAVFCL